MDQIIPEIIGRIMDTVTGYITKQVRYVTSYKRYATKMRNTMETLKGRRIDVTEHKSKNKMYSKEIPARVEGWLKDVERLRNEVENIPSNAIGCLHMKTRYRAGRNASKATARIQELLDEVIDWTDAQLPTGRPTSTSMSIPSSGEVGFKSREIPFNEALKFLQQDDGKSQVIALCGMGGIGKTTLMKQLKTVADEKKMFGWFVELTIGKEPNMHSIQNTIAECFGGQVLQSETKRAESLRNMFRLKLEDGKKKILVILDDVWSTIPLEDIGLTCPLPNGVTLLLTSRDAGICKTIAASARSGVHVVNVNVLEVAEANNFFSELTEVLEKDDHDKYRIGCEIVKKCGYLPLAIHLIATTIKFQDVREWRVQLNRLKHNDLDKNVQEIIKISYENVDVKDKEILRLCGLFPEDFNIPIEYLMRYAWGLKLWKYDSTLGDARDHTIASVNKLINANLLMNSNYLGCVKLHDLVLSFVLTVVSESYPAWIINHGDVSKWDRDERGESCKRISLTCTGMSTFPRNLEYSDLSLLQLMYGDELLKFPEDFYQNMHNLKVMAYYEMNRPLLARSLKCSTNLRALCLHKCVFFDLSFIGDLVNLEELSLAGCGIRKLPSAIGNLRKLKLLDVSGCVDLHIDDGVFGNLKDLEELYMRVDNARTSIMFTGDNFEELKGLLVQLYALEVEFLSKENQPKNVSFKKLDRFKISIGCLFEKENENEKYSFRNTLKLKINHKDFLDCKIDELFKKTEKLHLDVRDMIHLKDVVSVHPYDQHLFHDLRDLEVSNCAELKYLFTIPVAVGLRKLERLTISSCSVLEAVVHNDGSEINSVGEMIKFEELKFLSLEKLPELVSLFPSDCVVELPHLIELELQGLPNFTSIYPDPDSNNISAFQHPLLSSRVKIPHLEKLKLKSLEKLKQIWTYGSEEVANSISTLREIEVAECGSFENLFPSNPMLLPPALTSIYISNSGKEEVITTVAFPSNLMHSFPYLEYVELISYNNVGVVFEIESPSSNRELVTTTTNNTLLPNLQRLKLWDMKSMSHVWKCNNWNRFLSLEKQESFLNLTTITLWYCQRIRYLFSPRMAKLFSNLKEIGINRCENMEEVISKRDDKDEVISAYTTITFFPSLHTLSLYFLSNLKSIGGARDDKVSHNGIVPWSLCQFPKEILINRAQLSSVIPSYVNGQMQKLEKLSVMGCELLTEVFETHGINDNDNARTSLAGPRPDIVSFPKLSNLKTLYIVTCNLLQHVFTFSTLESLGQLQDLTIACCDTMKEIVKQENDNQRKVVEFPRLKSLELETLPNLEGFFLGLNEFEWPSLEKVTISECARIRVFTASESRAKELKYIHTSLGKHTLECGLNFDLTSLPHQKLLPSSESRLPWWSFHNLVEIDVMYKHEIKNIILSNELLQVQKLERIRAAFCGNVEEVFEVAPMEGTSNESQTVVEIPNLRHMELEAMFRLEYMWKSKYHVELEFPNLTRLSLVDCSKLKHVFTSAMIGSLARLEELHVIDCYFMKSVVDDIEDEEEESKCDLILEHTVVLPRLKVLKLQNLPNLMGFCFRMADFSCPSLDTLEIKKCPRMMLFTRGGHLDTPALDVIHTSFGRCYRGEDDINSFIKTKQEEGFKF